jgi:uncharacterized protein with HEPN domain
MRREAERLQDILDAIAAIERYASQGRQAFDEQELIQVWVIHHLQIIGEAANSLSGDLMNRYSEVPWAQIASNNLLRSLKPEGLTHEITRCSCPFRKSA